MQSRSWGYCTMLSPRMQPSAWVLKSRLGQLAGARAHQEASARAHRGLSFGEHAAGGLRTKRFHQKKSRRSCPPPYLTSEGQIKEKARQLAGSRAHSSPQGHVSGEKGRRHLLTRPGGRISATPHKTWVMRLLLTCPSSFLRPWGNFWLALSVTAAPCQRLGCRLGRPLGNVPPGRSGPEGRAK